MGCNGGSSSLLPVSRLLHGRMLLVACIGDSPTRGHTLQLHIDGTRSNRFGTCSTAEFSSHCPDLAAVEVNGRCDTSVLPCVNCRELGMSCISNVLVGRLGSRYYANGRARHARVHARHVKRNSSTPPLGGVDLYPGERPSENTPAPKSPRPKSKLGLPFAQS